MVLKVGVGVPLVWRSPNSLQFGVDEPLVVLDEVSEADERMISALVSGISRSGFDMMARTLGLGVEPAAHLLERLAPVLEPAATPSDTQPGTTTGTIAVEGDGPLADELRRVLDAEGRLAAPSESAPDLAVIVAGWVIAPEDHGSWLRRDIPHLPVVVGDGGVTIGPMVEPGSGPCLYCVQLTRTDEDAAWPAIATQLWNRPSPAMTPLAIAEAVAFLARRLRDRLGAGPATGSLGEDATSWRLDAHAGDVSSRAWTQHAACRCAAPAESDWAPVAVLGSRPSTRRAAVDAVPA